MKKVLLSLIILLAWQGWGQAQISNFKKVKKFGLDWISKEQVIQPGQNALLPADSFINETKQGKCRIKRVGELIQVWPGDQKPLIIVWFSLVKKEDPEEEFRFNGIPRNPFSLH